MPQGKHKKETTAQVAERLARPVLAERGLELWDVRFEKEGGSWYLRYFIDKEDGVNIGDCEYVSRAVEKLLDEEDPIEQSYVLEVGSPGVERELTKDWHYGRYIGRTVRVKLFTAQNGRREYVGGLAAKDAESVTIKTDDGEIVFTKRQVAGVRLYDDYDIGGLD